MKANKAATVATCKESEQLIEQQRDTNPRFLRLPDVKSMTALSKASIYKRMRLHAFPQAIKLGSRLTVWLESDVQGWINFHVKKARRVCQR